MSLTAQQLATLKTAIIANPTANAFRVAGDTVGLMGWCNGASGALAWSSAVASNTSDEAATYTGYDSIVQGKRDSWAIFLRNARDFSKNKVRNWITDVWGAATAGSIAESILQAGTEPLTNAQSAIGGTVRTTGTVSATDRSYTGQVSAGEASLLVN